MYPFQQAHSTPLGQPGVPPIQGQFPQQGLPVSVQTALWSAATICCSVTARQSNDAALTVPFVSLYARPDATFAKGRGMAPDEGTPNTVDDATTIALPKTSPFAKLDRIDQMSRDAVQDSLPSSADSIGHFAR